LPLRRWKALACVLAVIGCSSAAADDQTDLRVPLGARLTATALTGAPVPLRFDTSSGARLIRSTAADLPAITYSPAQARHGEEVYRRLCVECHPASQFVGERFVQSWNDRRVFDFYALVRSTMPLNDPGSLKEDEYLGVLAYLLEANHAAAGNPADSLLPDTTALRARKIAVHYP
jgi:mono/diheme cytochrome c family protein